VKTEAPFTRVVSLFAAYVFFYTQVENPVPPLRQLVNIPIPYGETSVFQLVQSNKEL
jgi:hypothetical protein